MPPNAVRSGEHNGPPTLPRIHTVDVSPPRPNNSDSPPLVTLPTVRNVKPTPPGGPPQSRPPAAYPMPGAPFGVTGSAPGAPLGVGGSANRNTPLSISVPVYGASHSQHHLPISPARASPSAGRAAYVPISPPKRAVDNREMELASSSLFQRQSSMSGWSGYQPPQLLKQAQRGNLYKPTYEAISPVSDDEPAAPDDAPTGSTQQLLANGKTIVFGAHSGPPPQSAGGSVFGGMVGSLASNLSVGVPSATVPAPVSAGVKTRKDELVKAVGAITQNVRANETQIVKLRSVIEALTEKRRRREPGVTDEPSTSNDTEDAEQDAKALSFSMPAWQVYAVNRQRKQAHSSTTPFAAPSITVSALPLTRLTSSVSCLFQE